MTLIELMVVLFLLALVSAVAVPTLSNVFDVEQRSGAREMAQLYRFLVAEASLRNVTFRIAFNLDTSSWKIEVGDPEATVFGTPEELAEWERDQQKSMHRFKKTDEAQAAAEEKSKFADLSYPGLDSQGVLPGDTVFGFVYTPQYSEPQRPSEVMPEDPMDQRIVYSYVYPNGTADYTVIRLVDANNPDDGYSVEVEPLSGETKVDGDLVDPVAAMSWVPTEAPTIR